MRRYYYRIYTGPTAVTQCAERFRAAAMPWQRVTIEGTEHIHVSIDALHADAALRECQQWADKSGLPSLKFETIRHEDI